MRKSLWLAVVWTIAGVSPLQAATAARGIGLGSCADYARLRQSDAKTADMLFLSWAEGFETGFNMSRISAGQHTVDLGVMPDAAQSAFLRNYCAQHPEQPYEGAAVSLIKTIAEMQKMKL
jgi:hypothetical protein